MDELEGYEELYRKVIVEVSVSLRLLGLKPDQQILALSDEVLAGLKPETSTLFHQRSIRNRESARKTLV